MAGSSWAGVGGVEEDAEATAAGFSWEGVTLGADAEGEDVEATAAGSS